MGPSTQASEHSSNVFSQGDMSAEVQLVCHTKAYVFHQDELR